MRILLPGLALALAAGCAPDARVVPDSPAVDGSGSAWRVGFIAPTAGDAGGALQGARLGALEALRAGDLIGRAVELQTARADGPRASVRAARRLAGAGAIAVMGGFDEPTCRALSEWAESSGTVYLNVGCRADALRRPLRNTFHVEASEAMYREAAAASPGADPVIWHPALTRYGAGQLNDRFRREFDAPPEPRGWASWMAVKLVWEGLLRGGTRPGGLAAVLAGDGARFDGHKGQPLAFEPSSGQLLQPLYLVDPASGSLLGGRAGDGSGASELPTASQVGLDGGPYVFVSNEGSGDVTVIDPRTRRAVARIPVGQRPRGIQVSPDGRRVYIALSDDAPDSESDRDAIAAIELPRGEVTRRHAAGSDPEQFALSPDGGLLYASNEDAGTASITELSTGEVLATLVVGIEPEGVAVSPDGRWIYVTAETSNTVSVIDARAGQVVASFLVDVRPRGVAFSPSRPRAYVTNEISGTVSVVDTREHSVVGTIELAGGRAKPVGVAVSPDGERVYVATGYANSVAVIDGATEAVIDVVPVGDRPWGLAVSADGRHVYTANGVSGDVSMIDARSLRVIETIPAGYRPWGVAVTP